VCARARARGLGGCDAPVAVPAPVFVRVRVIKAAEFATLQPTSRTVLRRCRCQLVIAGPTLCGRLGPARLLRHNDLVHAEHGDRSVCGELDCVPVFLLASHVRFGGQTTDPLPKALYALLALEVVVDAHAGRIDHVARCDQVARDIHACPANCCGLRNGPSASVASTLRYALC